MCVYIYVYIDMLGAHGTACQPERAPMKGTSGSFEGVGVLIYGRLEIHVHLPKCAMSLPSRSN